MSSEERMGEIKGTIEQISNRLNHVESDIEEMKSDMKDLRSEMVTKREADKLWKLCWIILGTIWTTLIVLVISILLK